MRTSLLGDRSIAEGVGWVFIAYGVAMLAGLLFVGWLLTILLFDSWGVSPVVPTVALVLALLAGFWIFARMPGLIRITVSLSVVGLLLGVLLPLTDDSTAGLYAVCAVALLGFVFLPDLAAKAYERRTIRRRGARARSA